MVCRYAALSAVSLALVSHAQRVLGCLALKSLKIWASDQLHCLQECFAHVFVFLIMEVGMVLGFLLDLLTTEYVLARVLRFANYCRRLGLPYLLVGRFVNFFEHLVEFEEIKYAISESRELALALRSLKLSSCSCLIARSIPFVLLLVLDRLVAHDPRSTLLLHHIWSLETSGSLIFAILFYRDPVII